MAYLSKEAAQKHFANLLAYHNMQNSFATKVPSFKNELENEILPEVTKADHFKRKYENNSVVEEGQRKWLEDNQIRRNKNGDIISGSIPKDVVSKIITIFTVRDPAEHEKKTNNAEYLGIFNTMAQTISCLSETPVPEEIQRICDGKGEPVKTTSGQPYSEELKLNPVKMKKAVKGKDDNSEQTYTISLNYVETGPFTFDQVKEKFFIGEIPNDAYICKNDMCRNDTQTREWKRIHELPEFKDIIEKLESYVRNEAGKLLREKLKRQEFVCENRKPKECWRCMDVQYSDSRYWGVYCNRRRKYNKEDLFDQLFAFVQDIAGQ